MDALCVSAKEMGCSPRDAALALLSSGLSHKTAKKPLQDFGLQTEVVLNANYAIHTIHLDFIPGGTEKIELLISPCGNQFFKSWNIIEGRRGNAWAPCREDSDDFSEKRRHHFLEPITRAEAFSLVRDYLVPEVFQTDFVARVEG